MAASSFTIWGRANSVNVQKVLWLSEELGLAFERVDAGLHFGRNTEPDYLAMNPNGRVPTLVEADYVLWESNTILRYVAQKYGADGAFYPKELRSRCQVDKWMDWILSSYQPPERDVFWGLVRTPPEKRDMAALQKGADACGKLWRMIEEDLATGHGCIVGDDISIADICVGAYARRWFGFEGVTKPELPHFTAWFQRMSTRPAYRRHLGMPLS